MVSPRHGRRSPALLFVAALAPSAACDGDGALTQERCDVAFAAASATLSVGGRDDAVATAHCERTTPQVRYTSSAPDVVAVDPLTGRMVGMGSGSATVTAQVLGAAGVVATLPVTVTCAPFLVAPSVRPTALAVVAGGQARLAVDYVASSCARAADTTFAFASSDTALAVVRADGTVVAGRRSGQGVITVTSAASPPVRLSVPFTVIAGGPPISALTVSPTALTIAPSDTARIRWSVTFSPATPDTVLRGVAFAVSDSCVARVSPDGLVTAGGASGAVATITVASVAFPTVSQTVGVTVGGPVRGPAIALHSVTTGSPPAPAPLAALRGRVTASLTMLRAHLPSSGRVEAWLGGRLAGATPFARPAPGETITVVPVTVETAARDSAGRPLFANGAHTLEFRAHRDGGGAFPGCPGPPAGLFGVAGVPVTVANP